MPELPNLKRELKSRSWPKVFGLAGAGERQLLFICHESFRIPNLKPFAFRMGQAVWDGVASFRQEFINCPPDMITYGIETGYRKQLTHFAGCHGMRSD